MANDSEADRPASSMRSLLARIEAEAQPAGSHPQDPRPQPEARPPPDGDYDAGDVVEFPSSQARRGDPDAAQRAPRRSRPAVPPMPQRPDPMALDQKLMLQLAHAQAPQPQSFVQSLGGLPLILSTAVVFVAAAGAGLWMVMSPRVDEMAAARAGRSSDPVRTVTTRVVTADIVTPPRAKQAEADATADLQPQLVQPPEPRSRRSTDSRGVQQDDISPQPKTVASAIPLVASNIQPPSGPPVALVAPRLAVISPMHVVAGTRSAFPVRIEPPTAIEFVSRVVVRGLPGDVVIPFSQRGPAGSVIVAPNSLPGSILDLTGAKPGEAELEIEIQGNSQNVLDRVTAMLSIAPGAIPQLPVSPPVSPPLASSPPVQAAPVAAISPPPVQREAAPANRGDQLLSRGRALLTSGDVAGARLILERAIDLGSPAAVLVMGETYDPAALAALGVRGVPAEVTRARSWYQKARELGVAEADDRLRRLPSR